VRTDSAVAQAIRGLIILIVVVALLVILFKLIDHL
jgi:preprotein translocase subunit SecE